MPLAVSRRPRSGSPGSASAWRHRIRSMEGAESSSLRARAFSQQVEQLLLRRPGPTPRLGALVAAVLAELPRVTGVSKVGFESFGDDACLEFRVEYRERHFNAAERSEEHTSELQSQSNLVCRLLLAKK